MNQFKTEEVIGFIKSRKIAIYGAGFTASRVAAWMEKEGILENISCFIMTEPDKKIYRDKRVISISEYQTEDGFICIAAHEAVLDEMLNILKEAGVTDFLWIAPYMDELELGAGSKKKKTVRTKDIMQIHAHDYMIAVRYLAVLEFYGKIAFGYEVYQRGIGLISADKTTAARLRQFIRLIENWERKGYDGHSRIRIGLNDHLVDGSHRFSLAMYHNLPEIECIQYGYAVHRTGGMWDRALIRENVFECMGLEDYMMDAVRRTQEYLLYK